MEFKDLKLSKQILTNLVKINYEETTPIQEMAIPKILENKDVIGLAQTGTGKTAAFSLPMLDKLIKKGETDRKTKALILTPTRELAIQIRDNIRNYSLETNYKCSVILGGVNQNSQVKVLEKGVEIIVATPGRLLDLIKQKKADITNIHTLILDEADTMLDMGFIRDIKSIISYTPKNRQTLLFSATMSDEIKKLTTDIMNNPVIVKTNNEEITADKINQELYFIDKGNKLTFLLEILDSKEKPTTLIFTRTKHGANNLEKKLNEFGIKTSVIHGNKTQSNRVKALNDFKNNKTRIMIATDIAARGIDIKDLNLVINFDMPEKPELYVHRIGRTARAGKSGKAISLCSSAEMNLLRSVEKIIKMKIPVLESPYKMVLKEKEEVKLTRRPSNRNTKNVKSNKKEYKPKTNTNDTKRPSSSYKSNDSKRPSSSYKSNDSKRPSSSYKSNDSKRPSSSYKTNDSKRPGSSYKTNDSKRTNSSYKSNDNRKSFNKTGQKRYNKSR
ncbi:MAG: DEAD/DEAH box helicase [Mycoplasmatota bacterium]